MYRYKRKKKKKIQDSLREPNLNPSFVTKMNVDLAKIINTWPGLMLDINRQFEIANVDRI